MLDFIQKYFIEPTVLQTGYNPVNTAVYTAFFIFVMVAAIKYFNRSRIKLTKRIWFELLPFVFLGGILRTLFDLGFFSHLGIYQYFFITPLIYLTIFLLILASSAVSIYYKSFRFYAGIFLVSSFGLILLSFGKNLEPFLAALFFSSAVYICILSAVRLFGKTALVKGVNSHVVFGHILDACSAVIAITKGYTEAQILSTVLMTVSPILFIAVKALLPLLLLRYVENIKGNTNFILKFALLILGLPQGIHGALLLLTT
jgi:uncharacterized membrane protein